MRKALIRRITIDNVWLFVSPASSSECHQLCYKHLQDNISDKEQLQNLQRLHLFQIKSVSLPNNVAALLGLIRSCPHSFFIPSIPSYWATILVTNEQPQTSVCCSSLWGRHIIQLRSEGGTAAGRTLIKTTSVAMRRKVEKKRWSEKDGQEQRKGMKRVCMKKQERVIGSKTLMTLLCSGKAASCAIHHQNLYISFS